MPTIHKPMSSTTTRTNTCRHAQCMQNPHVHTQMHSTHVPGPCSDTETPVDPKRAQRRVGGCLCGVKERVSPPLPHPLHASACLHVTATSPAPHA